MAGLQGGGRLLDKHGLAEILSVPVGWVVKAITARSIPITWIGRHARFSSEDIAQIIAAGREQPADTPVLQMVRTHPPGGLRTPPPPTGPRLPQVPRLDPDSPKGRQIAANLAQVLAEIELEIERRAAASGLKPRTGQRQRASRQPPP